MRTAGRIRTYDNLGSQPRALSAELQRYAIWNLDCLRTAKINYLLNCAQLIDGIRYSQAYEDALVGGSFSGSAGDISCGTYC